MQDRLWKIHTTTTHLRLRVSIDVCGPATADVRGWLLSTEKKAGCSGYLSFLNRDSSVSAFSRRSVAVVG